MADLDSLLAELRAVTPGSHVHIDDLIANPPSPGSRAWLPIIAELIDRLVRTGENWTIVFPAGSVREPYAGALSIDRALEIVDQSHLVEPPSVHRLHGTSVPNRWEGEDHS